MALDDLLDKTGLGFAHILDRLTGHRVGQEADEIAGMTCGERHPDLAVVLHTADPGTVPGARVENDERPLVRVDRGAFGRDDPHQPVIHRARQRAAIEQEFGVKAQDMRRFPGIVLDAIVATLAQYIQQ